MRLMTWRALSVSPYAAVFEVLTPEPTKRLVSEGVPVMAGAPIVLLHSQTNQCLSVEVGHDCTIPFRHTCQQIRWPFNCQETTRVLNAFDDMCGRNCSSDPLKKRGGLERIR